MRTRSSLRDRVDGTRSGAPASKRGPADERATPSVVADAAAAATPQRSAPASHPLSPPPARARSASSAAGPPLAQDPPAAAVLDRGQVDDRRRLPGQLAAVDREVDTRRGSPDRRRRSGRGPARRCGWRSSGRSRRRRRRAGRRAGGRRAGRAVVAAGERVAVLGVREDEGERAREQRRDRLAAALAEAGEELAHRQRREVHDRRGLAVVAALDRVDALDRVGAERVAGEPVEAVGREQGDAAGEDAAVERRRGPRRRRRARSRRPRSALIAARPRPARSRRGPARVSTSPKPASATRPATAGRLPDPDLERDRVAAGPGAARRERREHLADHVEAVGAGEQRLGGLVVGTSGGSAARSSSRT